MADNNIPETLTLSESNFEISALKSLLSGHHRMLWKELYSGNMSSAELESLRAAYIQLEHVRSQIGLNI